MFLSWISAILLAACLGVVTSDYNAEVCSVIKESNGLIPPPMPTNFELRRELVDNERKEVKYEEMYFDYTNSRAKYMYLEKGIEHHYLFDYEVEQVVHYDIVHPGVDIKQDPLSRTCYAVDMDDDSDFVELFGYIESPMGSKPKMFNSYQAMRFGGLYRYAFNGTDRMSERGLLIDKYIGCIYDDSIDATINSTYLFTSKTNLGVGAAGGTKEGDLTGMDNGLLSVPVKADWFGTVSGFGDEEAEMLNLTMNYFWFKGEPEFKMETFRIPPYLYCNNYRGRKNMTKFPTAFSTRVQLTTMQADIMGKLTTNEVTSFENILYYQEKNLARRDFTPGPRDGDIKSKFQNSLPVKTIYDFNEGLMYISHMSTGRCYIRPIDHGDFFETPKNLLYITMGTPEEIFQMETDEMEYKGQDFTRDIECDVWAGKYFDKTLNATYIKETYISTNGWHEEADELAEYAVPVKHTVIQEELNGELVEGVRTYNFLKFYKKPPMLSDFDVSNCIETQNHRDFAILLTISDATKKLLFDYRPHFLDTAQSYISEVTQLLSPVRVQRLHYRIVSNSNPRPVLLVTLVDKIKLKTKIPIGQKGASLDDAAINLQNFIDKNQFAIRFYAPDSKEMTLVPALKGSLYVKTSSGDLTYFAPALELVEPSSDETEDLANMMHDEPVDLESENSKGMSSSALALLAFAMLFIGIGIGVCIMYLYLRRQSESNMEDRIVLSVQNSVEVPEIPKSTAAVYENVE